MKTRKAMGGIGVALVAGMVMLAVCLIVGLVVTGQLYTTAAGMDLGTSGNATRTTLFANVYAAFNLSVILPIVAAAGLIIASIGIYFGYKGRA